MTPGGPSTPVTGRSRIFDHGDDQPVRSVRRRPVVDRLALGPPPTVQYISGGADEAEIKIGADEYQDNGPYKRKQEPKKIYQPQIQIEVISQQQQQQQQFQNDGFIEQDEPELRRNLSATEEIAQHQQQPNHDLKEQHQQQPNHDLQDQQKRPSSPGLAYRLPAQYRSTSIQPSKAQRQETQSSSTRDLQHQQQHHYQHQAREQQVNQQQLQVPLPTTQPRPQEQQEQEQHRLPPWHPYLQSQRLNRPPFLPEKLIENEKDDNENGEEAAQQRQWWQKTPAQNEFNLHHQRPNETSQPEPIIPMFGRRPNNPNLEVSSRRPQQQQLESLPFRTLPPAFYPIYDSASDSSVSMNEQQKSSDILPPRTNSLLPKLSHSCSPINLHFLFKIYERRKHGIPSVGDRSEFLQGEHFPAGLVEKMLEHDLCPIRIWLLDNSSTMRNDDTYTVIRHSTPSQNCAAVPEPKLQLEKCTRWHELSSAIVWHAELAAWRQTPMAFRLVNQPKDSPQQFGIAASNHCCAEAETKRLQDIMTKETPDRSIKPLTSHLEELVPSIIEFNRSVLDPHEKFLSLVICADGKPTDANTDGRSDKFLDVLQKLRGQRVWLVIRLSTPELRVYDYYKHIQNVLATPSPTGTLDIQVVRDVVAEAKAVHHYNPWLNYGLPLHLCREQGLPVGHDLGCRPLSLQEIVEFVRYTFGKDLSCLLNPNVAKKDKHKQQLNIDTSFLSDLQGEEVISLSQYKLLREQLSLIKKEYGTLWNPAKQKHVDWFDLNKLDKQFKPNPSKKWFGL